MVQDLLVENKRPVTLMEVGDNESKMMSKPCLELISGGVVSACEIILQDHIAEGKYTTPDEDLCSENTTAPITNAKPEHDIQIHHPLMKVKPKL